MTRQGNKTPAALRRPEDLAVSSGVLNTSDGGAARIAAVAVGILHYDRVMDGYGWLSVVVIVITEHGTGTKDKMRESEVCVFFYSRICSATCIQDHIQAFGNQEKT